MKVIKIFIGSPQNLFKILWSNINILLFYLT